MKSDSCNVYKELIEYIKKIPKNEKDLLIEAIEDNFTSEYFNGKLVSKDWKKSKEHEQELMKIISQLFTEQNGNGFPKAIRFWEIYFGSEFDEHIVRKITNRDAIFYFLTGYLPEKNKQ
jgi:hypothetical protein